VEAVVYNGFDLPKFLERFDTGNVFNANDMILILRASDTGLEHILADIIEAQRDKINELEVKLRKATHRRSPRQQRKKQ
jgi:hypothetical protein